MSSVKKTTRTRRKKPVEDDFSPPANLTEDVKTENPVVNKRRPRNGGSNSEAKSRLTLIVDMLKSTDKELDQATLRYNVSIAVKHLEQVLGMLS